MMKPEAILHSNKDLKVVSHHITIHTAISHTSSNQVTMRMVNITTIKLFISLTNIQVSNIVGTQNLMGGRINDIGKILWTKSLSNINEIDHNMVHSKICIKIINKTSGNTPKNLKDANKTFVKHIKHSKWENSKNGGIIKISNWRILSKRLDKR